MNSVVRRKNSFISNAASFRRTVSLGTPTNVGWANSGGSTPLNTGFLGTPMAGGGYAAAFEPLSPFFGDETPIYADDVKMELGDVKPASFQVEGDAEAEAESEVETSVLGPLMDHSGRNSESAFARGSSMTRARAHSAEAKLDCGADDSRRHLGSTSLPSWALDLGA